MQITYQGQQAEEIRRRIKAAIKAAGTTQNAVAERMGTDHVTVSRVLGARTEIAITQDWVGRFATALQLPVDNFAPASGTGVRMVPVRGTVEAGIWTEGFEPPPDDGDHIPIPDMPELRHFSLYAARVRGESMNRRYPPGSFVVVSDQVERGDALVVGKPYVVERERASGERELTVKLVWEDRGKLWLIPDSDDPLFEAVPVEGAENETIRILGRVVYAIRPE